jgi:ferritin-like metal-binding protein YciE
MTEYNITITTLHNLLDYETGKFTNAELQLKNSLPEWISKATSLKLKMALEKYFDFVQVHVRKMESFFEDQAISTLGFTNHVMQAFIEETNDRLSRCTDIEVRDACLLASVQGINHFKISSYGTAAAFANVLGMEKAATIFHEAEVNEKQIDDRLSQLAEHEINIKAKTPIVLRG